MVKYSNTIFCLSGKILKALKSHEKLKKLNNFRQFIRMSKADLLAYGQNKKM
jgi:hypothetical protein